MVVTEVRAIFKFSHVYSRVYAVGLWTLVFTGGLEMLDLDEWIKKIGN